MRTTASRFAGLLIGAAALLSAFSPPAAAGDAEVVKGELGKKLDAAVQRATRGAFWGAILVAKDGEILLAKGYGMADYDSRPNDANTLFEIASTTKQFTAAAVLKLEMERKLKLTDKLTKFLRNVPKDKRDITIHHLLTHTSGITGRAGVPYASTMSRAEYIRHVLKQPMVSKPGEEFAYNNATYALLAAIVEEVSRKSFEEYSEEKLFKPAGMKDTGFIRDKDLDRARDTVRRGKRMPEATAIDWHWGWGYRGMGGVITTVHDLFLWDQALRGNKVLDAKTREKLFTPNLENYACGWKVEPTDRGTRRIHHSGGVHGFACQYVRYPGDDVVIAVLSNGKTNIMQTEQALSSHLFRPVPMTAVLNVKDFKPDERQIAKLPDTMGWTAKKDGQGVAVQLMDTKSKKVAATIRLPRGSAEKLRHDLASALRSRPKGAGDAPAVEAGMYLQPYRLSGPELKIEDGLSIMLRPRYRGSDGTVDPRITFSLVDRIRRQWPVMVKMGPAPAQALLDQLRAALE